jgi:hypothetical protein
MLPTRLLLVARLPLANGRYIVGVDLNEVDLEYLLCVRHRSRTIVAGEGLLHLDHQEPGGAVRLVFWAGNISHAKRRVVDVELAGLHLRNVVVVRRLGPARVSRQQG